MSIVWAAAHRSWGMDAGAGGDGAAMGAPEIETDEVVAHVVAIRQAVANYAGGPASGSAVGMALGLTLGLLLSLSAGDDRGERLRLETELIALMRGAYPAAWMHASEWPVA